MAGRLMAEIVNLNKARKQRQRERDQQQAAENRVRYGRSKAEKALDAARAAEARERLDALRREPLEPATPTQRGEDEPPPSSSASR
ncbi:MAG TPA: DUF4169 family protein [Nevskiaceae bacterium]|nr:DUF4169 family protein [Nevskiaceae bacterium]